MKKFSFILILLSTLLLTACGGAATTPVVAPTQTKTLPVLPTVAAATPTTNPIPTITPFPGGCATVSLMPPADPSFPAVTTAEYALGPADAAVTLVEYSDFQCPVCAQVAPIIQKIVAANSKDVRLVYRFFPLTGHPLALISAQAADAAGRQGKFWELHDILFSKQVDWELMTETAFVTWVTDQAKSLGLDTAKFSADLKDPAVVKKIAEAQVSAETIGLPGTPFLLANGLYVGDQVDESVLNTVVTLITSLKNLESRVFKECPSMTIDKAKSYTATINTTKGDIVIQLFADKAPLAVNSFVFLAQKGWFDGNPFHRVIAGFVAQTGDPTGTGRGNPGYAFINEINSDLKFDKEGVVGLANSGPNSNGSQFFITFDAQPHLDGGYTIFGQVIKGLDVAKALIQRDPSTGGTLPDPDKINTVTIEVK
jgi:cyclophilin family peptidyl-prolyl cis-trans isomerase/protein-disulfide isomerase